VAGEPVSVADASKAAMRGGAPSGGKGILESILAYSDHTSGIGRGRAKK
jgi:hypothetical protein